MARYLTPARICTLVLIEAYQNDELWANKPETSSTIFGVIARDCLQTSEHASLDLSKAVEVPRNVLEYGKPLEGLDRNVPGRSWLSLLIKDLWTLHTIDELHELFHRCMQLLATASDHTNLEDERADPITRASPVGRFIRKCNVEFTRLQFAETLTLWHAFVAYREPSRAIWSHHYPAIAKSMPASSVGQLGSSGGDHSSDSILVGSDTIDTLLCASVSQLQKLGQRVPEQVKTKLGEWLSTQQASRMQYLHHFMAFFDTWRAGQYSLALENLHRYFDYAVAKDGGEDMKIYYQYALLHLSALHADFEHWDDSISAMKECIATARENQDTACLNFALSWLLYLRQSGHTRNAASLRSLAAIAGEGGSERDEIAFLKAKARDSKHWSLMSSTLLEETKYELRHYGICAKAAELVLQSSYLNAQHALRSMIPATAVFQHAIYDRLGQAHLAKTLLSSVNMTQHCSLADSTRIVCRLAYYAAQHGHYTEALAMLQDYRPRISGTLKLEQRLTALAEALALLRAVRRSDIQAAEYHMINLRPVRDFADLDLVGLIEQLDIALLMKRRQLSAGLQRVNAALERSKTQDNSDIAETLSLLMQKANIFAAAGRATKGFSIALRAALSAQRCHVMNLFVEALHTLARIFNDLGKFEAACELSQAALPYALEGSNLLVSAQLFVTLGESYVGQITAAPQVTESRQSHLAHVASSHIERGREIYEQIEEYEGQLDCLLMLARLARWADDEPSAVRADAKYHQLVIEHDARQLQ
ncbi:hypothetical protein AMS68_004814 [Peltaster fructicola]|uniref:Anaphase-promoting complex subunit 5 n=1 Tax=Peltaster fructicola TaxID=286661 RepID=A0A6H0XWZ9_9PEZI|nr:hypothetical protein AMS68_004814 [Peltaster fructicola]